MAHAEGSFTVASWDEATYRELGNNAKLSKASMAFRYTGELEATGSPETLMFYRPDSTAVYTGLERIEGRLAGRSGSFVMLADGTFEGGTATTAWRIIEGSGTEELAGIRGSGTAVSSGSPGGTYELDYELG
jgi:hypothetical protein